jgi:hypothetical protein
MKWVHEMRTDPTLNGLLAATSVEDLYKYPQLHGVVSLLEPSTQDTFLTSLDTVPESAPTTTPMPVRLGSQRHCA